MDASKDILEALLQRHPGLASLKVLTSGLLAAFILGFGISKYIDLAEIGGLERSNGALKDQVELYKAKLQVGSPEEALTKLQALEAKIEALQPKAHRRLDTDQRHDLAIALAPIAKQIVPQLFVFFEGSQETMRYSSDFMEVFKTMNVPVIGPNIGYRMNETDKGVLVGLKYPDHPSDLALKFIDALRKAGVEASTTHWPNAESLPGLDFNLFVSSP